jgi:hypothetical protein
MLEADLNPLAVLDIAFGVTLISSMNIMSYKSRSPSWPMLLA